ncbi:uncharacterized protein [Drosophila bipectinata]|uniref:uncharacterized protein n=1 Tax=Drosophila bipectinata TaxID=42026 RepID=UPI001C8AABEB|nr:uncharacterized protein LOC108127700 [Drosophila bipectinata]
MAQEPAAEVSNRIITMSIDDLRRVASARMVDLLLSKKEEELQLRRDRVVMQAKLVRRLTRINKLDKSADEEQMTDAEFCRLDALRMAENFRYQQMAERLVRTGAQLFIVKRDLKNMELAIYNDFIARRSARTTTAGTQDQSTNQNS